MEKKNVLHVISVSFSINYFFGNQFNYLSSINGNRYFLVCSPSEELIELSGKLNYTPLAVCITRTISPFRDFLAILKIFRLIKINKIDVVVGHTPKGGMVAMLAAYLAGVKYRVYFRHGIIYETSRGVKKFILKNIDRLSGNIATKVVCVSHSVKEISDKDNLNNPKKNVILGLGTCSGIDTEEKYNPMLQKQEVINKLCRELNFKEHDFVIGFVGRIVQDKGINELIEAFNILEKKHHNLKLLLVGPIEERDSVSESSLNEIQQNPNIINTGFVMISAPYFKLMDVFVLPTYREGFPTVSLEASSMQVPVLITRATGCEESIIENKTGMFIKNSAEDIAEKIEIYLKDEKLKNIHGTEGRKFVRFNFEEKKIWDHIDKQLGY